MMTIRKAIFVYFILLCVVALQILPAFASPNVDGGAGSWGTGDKNNYWRAGYDGVRITVINKTTNKPASASVDWVNSVPFGSFIHFEQKCKLEYMENPKLKVEATNNTGIMSEETQLPPIISVNGTSNIAAIRRYFSIQYHLELMAGAADVILSDLDTENYSIMVEPLAFFVFQGANYCMTATEAALYNDQVEGLLYKRMGNLTHKNLPASMWLRDDAFGIEPWQGGVKMYSGAEILQSLGVGEVSLDPSGIAEGAGGTGGISGVDYIYRTGTEVITSVTIHNSGDEITWDNPAWVEFDIPGWTADTKMDFVVQAGREQICWTVWTTPDEPGPMTINVTSSLGESIELNVEIIELVEQTPPDPSGTDRNNSFTYRSPPADNHSASWDTYPATDITAEWKVWNCEEVEVESDEEDEEDEPKTEWVFWQDTYKVNFLDVQASISPSDNVETATADQMKSGYGITSLVEAEAKSSFSSGAPQGLTGRSLSTSTHTAPQTAIATFPEFRFQNYNRILEQQGGQTWTFSVNPYSMLTDHVHFTPVWYPDGKYPVHFEIRDLWTPVGELRVWQTSNSIAIDGSVYDDWYVQRQR